MNSKSAGLKALLLDMDDTLCDTQSANRLAVEWLIADLSRIYPNLESKMFVDTYLQAIYRNIDVRLKLLTDEIEDETEYRRFAFQYLLKDYGVDDFTKDFVVGKVAAFETKRMQYYGFYPGVESLLADLRKSYTLVVVTNGPVFSQRPKLDSVSMEKHVDFIIVGGEEPESKPAKSIFMKACRLASCEPSEALHAGDSYSADVEGANLAGIQSFWINESLDQLCVSYKGADFASPRFIDIKEILGLA